MPSSNKIVLTRPQAHSEPLAKKLTDLGYAVSLFPLWEITPVADAEALQTSLANLSCYGLAVFVSPNAIHAIFQNGFTWPSDVAIAVMGEGSRTALAGYGINATNTRIYCPVDSHHSDSEALLQQLDLPSLQDRGVVILRAESGRELLSDALKAHNIHVDKLVTYRRLTPSLTEHNQSLLLELLTDENNWVVSSSEAIRTLADMITKIDVAKLQRVNLFVSHTRIAETAEKCGFTRITLIGSGDENLLLALQSQP